MSRSVRLILLSITAFMVLFPLTAARPGQPPVLKADEPAYFLMALSLIEDGDLRCGAEDIQRAFDHFPFLPIDNLILMSADGWNTVFFGKPYVYSLLAAPAAALFGSNGMVAFNMALLMAMVWMGAVYLARFNAAGLAAFFSAAFFVLSPSFAYAFWLHPEIFNMFAVAASLFLAFHTPELQEGPEGRLARFRTALFAESLRPAWSAAALALGVYNKPVLALLGVPALYLFIRRRGWRGGLTFVAASVAAVALIAGVSVGLTGQPSAYLGVDRGGMKVLSTAAFEGAVENLRQATESHPDEAANSWQWILGLPRVRADRALENARYFLLGRHTGLVPYMPFAVLALALFLLHARRSTERWLNFAALTGTALFFLLWIPFNWYGGGGFIGNRYFINAYPAFLFLVTAIRPAWLLLAGSGTAALLLGSILFTPWGAAVPQPTLQAHVRGGLFRFFPLELGMRNQIAGYDRFGYAEAGFLTRKDVVKVRDASLGRIWVQGTRPAEIWLYSYEPLDSVLFEIATATEDNEIVLSLAGAKRTVPFEAAASPTERRRVVELTPPAPTLVRRDDQGRREHFYRLRVRASAARHERGSMINALVRPLFYIGVELNYLGSRALLSRPERFGIRWEGCQPADELAAGSRTDLPLRVHNDGIDAWAATGPTPVQLAYEWRDRDGTAVDVGQKRTRLAEPVPPGGLLETSLVLQAPTAPGRYTLVLDAVRRHVGWFSELGGRTCEATVEVTEAAP